MSDIAYKNQSFTPLYDSKIEYVQSTGTQFFIVPIFQHFVAEFDIQQYPIVTNNRFYCGFGGNNATQFWGFHYSAYSMGTTTSSIKTGNRDVVKWVTSSKHAENHKLYINGIDSGISVPSESHITNPNGNLQICAINGQFIMKMKLFSLKIWNEAETEMLFDFIPVRITNESNQPEAVLFDRLSRLILRNQGTGQFTIGPDV